MLHDLIYAIRAAAREYRRLRAQRRRRDSIWTPF